MKEKCSVPIDLETVGFTSTGNLAKFIDQILVENDAIVEDGFWFEVLSVEHDRHGHGIEHRTYLTFNKWALKPPSRGILRLAY